MKRIHSLTTAATLAATTAALCFGAAPSPASACNPEDCGGMSREELARDAAEIRRLNREQLRHVQTRDAEYAKGWDAQRTHAKNVSDYERAQAEHKRRMAEWREAVRRCNAGDRRYCAR